LLQKIQPPVALLGQVKLASKGTLNVFRPNLWR